MSDDTQAASVKRELTPTDSSVDETAKKARLDPEVKPETTSSKDDVEPKDEPEQEQDQSEMVMTYTHKRPNNEPFPGIVSKKGLKPVIPIMPPSLELVTGVKADLRARKGFVGQEEVGIIGYAGDPSFKGVKGVIKQRFTDFLVNEVGLDGEILRLKDIGKPTDPYDLPRGKTKGKSKAESTTDDKEDKQSDTETAEDVKPEEVDNQDDLPESLRFDPLPKWTSQTTRTLRSAFSDSTVIAIRALLVQGKNPPPKLDSGWGARKAKVEADVVNEEEAMNVEDSSPSGITTIPESIMAAARGQGRDRGRGRGRGGRGGGRGGRGGGQGGETDQWWMVTVDDREVLSQLMTSKEERTKAHQTIRELFSGTFDSSSRDVPGEEGQRISITWSRASAPNKRFDKREKDDRPRPPQYIHFTLHKTNRDTQDCIAHLSRALGCNVNELSVCGTKDKRAVTVQRVCFKRRNKNLMAVWKSVNNVRPGRNTEQQAVEERGDRGARIGDLEYSDKYLELGMLRGNHFAITLRGVQSEASREEIDAYLSNVKTTGFVNYYGMQRFGTSTVPTHITGLFILQGRWGDAADSILSLREGEHPECVRGRLAWLDDEDLDKALELMPRRCVAERSIWQHWKKTDRKDKLGALGSIPRNLRTMYVHAYQSYIWNLVVSERLKLSATKPLVGDLVFDGDADEDKDLVDESGKSWKPSNETSSSQEVKQLTEADLPNYTIHDVIMPLPGWNIDYPGGEIGELYSKILKADDLDAHKMRREQREYSLPGSYRKMIHLPSRFSWSHVSYTDPDVSLVQSDEDRILGLNPPAEHDPEGKFQALKIELTLGPSAYATMALREITREETSSWHHIGLTLKGEDQEFKGSSSAAVTETKPEHQEGDVAPSSATA